jgi:hypothetical protein
MSIHAGILVGMSLLLSTVAATGISPVNQSDHPAPPETPVKLIFIHHSTGENWLADGYGDLGRTLGENNYFVSDTNYSWGPDGIGDRTDIPNWTEWFASDMTPTYMQALFSESGQNASYTRTLSNPGGENEIIMFKSCFPNSALEGTPNDAPGTYEEMSVSGAKYVYNTILKYFSTRPDKLFIVITAPPLSDSTYADNARAFNNWLVNDWLRENNYTLQNVAVFDFYNILTDKNAHHWMNGNQVEHIQGKRNTLAYPSGDDHPNERGSRKATDEFIPLLNYYYDRWQSGNPSSQPPQQQPTSNPTEAPAVQPGIPATRGMIDDFEGQPPAGTEGWESYFQDNANTRLNCGLDSSVMYAGSSSLKFEYDVDKNSWATCGFYYWETQSWSPGMGIEFHLRSDKAGVPFDVDVYGGSPSAHATYVYHTLTPPESVNNWVLVTIPWEKILRAEWEENAGSPINPTQVTGFAVGFSTPENERLAGTLWLDNLDLVGAEGEIAAPAPAPGEEAVEEPQTEGEDSSAQRGLGCGGATIIPVAIAGYGWVQKRKNSRRQQA